jgi:hypothetical protein
MSAATRLGVLRLVALGAAGGAVIAACGGLD